MKPSSCWLLQHFLQGSLWNLPETRALPYRRQFIRANRYESWGLSHCNASTAFAICMLESSWGGAQRQANQSRASMLKSNILSRHNLNPKHYSGAVFDIRLVWSCEADSERHRIVNIYEASFSDQQANNHILQESQRNFVPTQPARERSHCHCRSQHCRTFPRHAWKRLSLSPKSFISKRRGMMK